MAVFNSVAAYTPNWMNHHRSITDRKSFYLFAMPCHAMDYPRWPTTKEFREIKMNFIRLLEFFVMWSVSNGWNMENHLFAKSDQRHHIQRDLYSSGELCASLHILISCVPQTIIIHQQLVLPQRTLEMSHCLSFMSVGRCFCRTVVFFTIFFYTFSLSKILFDFLLCVDPLLTWFLSFVLLKKCFTPFQRALRPHFCLVNWFRCLPSLFVF